MDGTDHGYDAFVSKKVAILTGMTVFIVCLALFSIGSGAYSISLDRIIATILGDGSKSESAVIWNIRIPRVIAAILVGCSLGVAGTIMQCILKNPLASPYTLGISNAAAFGAAMSLAASYFGFLSGTIFEEFLSGVYGMTLNAFLWSMITVAVIISLSRLVSTTPESMVLTGVALGAIFSAALSSLQYFVDDSTLSSMVYWQFGDLSKATSMELYVILVIFIPVILYFIRKAMDYNAMNVGEDVASSLGVNTKRTMILGMVLASAITAVCISIVGIIGFVGLLAPHIMRRIVGGDHRFLIPASMLMGAIILLVADIVGRLAFTFSLPVGIITSFLGGPLFIYILSKERKKRSV